MTKKTVYKVVFRGKILPKHKQGQVVDNIHRITKIPKQVIEKKFFSGKNVVIRHADTEEYAKSLQKIFYEAGIETSIETQSSSADEDSSTNTLADASYQQLSIENDQGTINKSLIKRVPVFVILVLGLLVSLFFLFYPKTQDKDLSTSTTAKIIKDSKKSLTVAENKPITKKTSVKSDRHEFFIQINNRQEHKRLTRFITYLNASESINNLILATIKNNTFISSTSPAYLFSYNQFKGALLPTDTLADKRLFNSIRDQLNNHNKLLNSYCAIEKFNLIISDDFFLIITSDQNNISATELRDSLNSMSRTHFPRKDSEVEAFNFYYLWNDSRTDADSLTVQATQEGFTIKATGQIQQTNKEILNYLGIQEASRLSTDILINNELQSLFDLTQLMIGQTYLQETTLTSSESFIPQVITDIIPSSGQLKLKPYNNNLEPEFQSQWQSGPFAMAINQIIFDKNVIIELQARGQNIPNLIEYSRQASMIPHTVYNRQNKNILDCKIKTSKSLFQDSAGQQDAFIGDDFISYYASSSTLPVQLKSGYDLYDAYKLEGSIHLNLAENIKKKRLNPNKQYSFFRFKHFSLLVEVINTKTIHYQVFGNDSYFLTIRASNKQGQYLATSNYNPIFTKNETIQVKQEFEREFDSLTILYSSKITPLKYDFSLKPELPTSQAQTIDRIKSTEPEIYNSLSNLSLPVDNAINDVPVWLGDKIKSVTVSPFNIALYLAETEVKKVIDNKLDAIINIKTADTGLINLNLTAVQLKLKKAEQIIFNEFLSFNKKIFNSVENLKKPQNPGVTDHLDNNFDSYLDNNTAIKIARSDIEKIQGEILVRLPTEIKKIEREFSTSSISTIKIDDLLIMPVRISRQKIDFRITGAIEKLVQLNLYNNQKQVISDPIEFRQTDNNEAILSLTYSDKIDQIQLYLSKKSIQKEFIFNFN